ncbi:hypothetical protein MAR_034643, partial [Mya arenaria]
MVRFRRTASFHRHIRRKSFISKSLPSAIPDRKFDNDLSRNRKYPVIVRIRNDNTKELIDIEYTYFSHLCKISLFCVMKENKQIKNTNFLPKKIQFPGKKAENALSRKYRDPCLVEIRNKHTKELVDIE